MSRAQALLEELSGEGFRIWLVGENLEIDGPEEVFTDERLEQIRTLKPEIVAFIRGDGPQLTAVTEAPKVQPPQTAENLAARADQLRDEWIEASCETWKTEGKAGDLVSARCRSIIEEMNEITRDNRLFADGYYIESTPDGPKVVRLDLDENGLINGLPKPEKRLCPTCGAVGTYWPAAGKNEACYSCPNHHDLTGWKAQKTAKAAR